MLKKLFTSVFILLFTFSLNLFFAPKVSAEDDLSVAINPIPSGTTTPIITGSVSSVNAIVEVTVKSDIVGQATVSSDGSWTLGDPWFVLEKGQTYNVIAYAYLPGSDPMVEAYDYQTLLIDNDAMTLELTFIASEIDLSNQEDFVIRGKTDPDVVVVSVEARDVVRNKIEDTTMDIDPAGNFGFHLSFKGLWDGNVNISISAMGMSGDKTVSLNLEKNASMLFEPSMLLSSKINQESETKYNFAGWTSGNGIDVYCYFFDSNNVEQKTDVVTPNQKGFFSEKIDVSDIPDGHYKLYYGLMNKAAGISSDLYYIDVEKDTTAPPIPTVILNKEYVNYQDQTVIVSGYTEPNAKVYCLATEGLSRPLHATLADNNGFYNIVLDLREYEQGNINIIVYADDDFENGSEVNGGKSIFKDTIAPNKPVMVGQANDINNESDCKKTFIIDLDNNVYFKYKVSNNGTIIDTGSTFVANSEIEVPFDFSSFENGEIVITMYAEDSYGNVGDELNVTFEKNVTSSEDETVDIDEKDADDNSQVSTGANNDSSDIVVAGNNKESAITSSEQLPRAGNNIISYIFILVLLARSMFGFPKKSKM